MEELSWTLPRDALERRLPDRDAALSLSTLASQIRAGMASRPALADLLIAREIDGRAYLDRAEEESDEPLLLLPTAAPEPTAPRRQAGQRRYGLF